MMPSWRSACSSARSSCFVLDNSRTAANMSVELTIQDLSVQVRGVAAERLNPKCEPCLLHGGQRHAVQPSTRRLEDGDLAALAAFEPNDLCFEPSAVQVHHTRPPAGEAAPLGRRPNDALARGRDLEDIAFADQSAPVETSLQHARCTRAVVDRHAGAIPPVDPHFDGRAGTGPSLPQLDEVESDRVKLFRYNALQLVVHACSQLPPGTARTKKCGVSPHISTRDTGSRAVD